MFCADYIACFVFHAGASAFLPTRFVDAFTAGSGKASSPGAPFIFGAFVGTASALAVYPFDVVRASVQPGVRGAAALGSFSVVPYAAVWFGLYFSGRDETCLSSQVTWGLASSTAAALAEAPFDHAKREMFRGSSAVAARVATSALWIPFATVILVTYDRALSERRKRHATS